MASELESIMDSVEYACTVCGSRCSQDADVAIMTSSIGLPICSQTCREAAEIAVGHGVLQRKELADAILDYVKLDLETEEHKAFFDRKDAALLKLQSLLGTEGHFQDDAGTVYMIDNRKGQWVDFCPFVMKRTKRGDEKVSPNPLSLDKAEELGYAVERKRAKAGSKTSPEETLVIGSTGDIIANAALIADIKAMQELEGLSPIKPEAPFTMHRPAVSPEGELEQ